VRIRWYTPLRVASLGEDRWVYALRVASLGEKQ